MTQPFTKPVESTAFAQEDHHHGRARLIDNFVDTLKERMQERKRERHANRAAGDTPAPGASIFENEGGIESVAKPKGFTRNAVDNNLGKYVESSDGKSKICYWKRDDFHVEADSAKQIDAILKKGPHTIMTKDPKNPDVTITDQKECDAAYDCLAPGRWSHGAPFDVSSISVKQINGKNVLAVDVDFQSGKKTTVLLFNPDSANNTLEHLWVESPNKADGEKLHRAVTASIKWRK